MRAVTNWVADLGQLAMRWIASLGDLAIFSWRTIVWMFTRLPRRETLLPAFYQIGVLSLPVVALTGTFIGMVLAVQSYFTVPRDAPGNAAGRGDQHVARPRAGAGAGGDDAGRPRRQRDGGRAGHDAQSPSRSTPWRAWAPIRFITWSCRGSSAAWC